VHDLGLLSVRSRLATFLLKNVDTDGLLAEGWTHDSIAASIGTVREVVSRTLAALAKSGAITLDRRRVEILDRTTLESAAGR
jgi:CRP/FNR family transcriptional regulator